MACCGLCKWAVAPADTPFARIMVKASTLTRFAMSDLFWIEYVPRQDDEAPMCNDETLPRDDPLAIEIVETYKHLAFHEDAGHIQLQKICQAYRGFMTVRVFGNGEEGAFLRCKDYRKARVQEVERNREFDLAEKTRRIAAIETETFLFFPEDDDEEFMFT